MREIVIVLWFTIFLRAANLCVTTGFLQIFIGFQNYVMGMQVADSMPCVLKKGRGQSVEEFLVPSGRWKNLAMILIL